MRQRSRPTKCRTSIAWSAQARDASGRKLLRMSKTLTSQFSREKPLVPPMTKRLSSDTSRQMIWFGPPCASTAGRRPDRVSQSRSMRSSLACTAWRASPGTRRIAVTTFRRIFTRCSDVPVARSQRRTVQSREPEKSSAGAPSSPEQAAGPVKGQAPSTRSRARTDSSCPCIANSGSAGPSPPLYCMPLRHTRMVASPEAVSSRSPKERKRLTALPCARSLPERPGSSAS
mmetsp:Transcript_50113/g.154863  ORF Transcript_50113/g.154863 Transcript_50113/m.154863 type:complete len:230 (-) Transcript_50113:239-928(-)